MTLLRSVLRPSVFASWIGGSEAIRVETWKHYVGYADGVYRYWLKILDFRFQNVDFRCILDGIMVGLLLHFS